MIGLAWDDLDRVRVWEASCAPHDSPHANAGLSLNASTERALAAADAAVWTAKGLRSIANGIPKSAGEAARICAVRLRMCAWLMWLGSRPINCGKCGETRSRLWPG
jgi:hypothetical protein